MKAVTIPTDKNPYIIHINNDVYTFNAGETVVVPDEVAAVLEEVAAAKPKENPPKPIIPEGGEIGQVLMKTETGYAWADLLPATEDAIGGVIVGTGLSVTKNGTIKASNATTTKRGVVFKGESVETATEDNVVDVVNALLESLEDAGVISGSARLL